MVVVCRRHAAWSIATFTDGLLTNYIVPLGPLLLLAHLEYRQANNNNAMASTGVVAGPIEAVEAQTGDGASSSEQDMHWAVVAKLWSEVCIYTSSRAVMTMTNKSSRFLYMFFLPSSTLINRARGKNRGE